MRDQPFAQFVVRDFRIGDADCKNGFALTCEFTPAKGAACDPTAMPVSVRLTRAAAPADFWPGGAKMPINGFSAHQAFGNTMIVIDQAERQRSGIEIFLIKPDTAFTLIDTNASIPGGDYASIEVELRIGPNVGRQQARLAEVPQHPGRWKLVPA